jgi:hypothetical protein
MACSMRIRVCGSIRSDLPLSTLDTVLGETPASRATW